MKKINYWTYSDSELRQELVERGLTEPETWDRKEVINTIKLNDGTTGKDMVIEDEKTGEVQTMSQLKEEDPSLKLRKVIFHSKDENDLPYVPVGLNGKAFYIPKEIEVEVPQVILDSCIKDAVEERMFPETDFQGNINWKTKRVQRYPYSVIE